jgi:hypothetical protein
MIVCPGRGAAFFTPLRRAGTASSAVYEMQNPGSDAGVFVLYQKATAKS